MLQYLLEQVNNNRPLSDNRDENVIRCTLSNFIKRKHERKNNNMEIAFAFVVVNEPVS